MFSLVSRDKASLHHLLLRRYFSFYVLLSTSVFVGKIKHVSSMCILARYKPTIVLLEESVCLWKATARDVSKCLYIIVINKLLSNWLSLRKRRIFEIYLWLAEIVFANLHHLQQRETVINNLIKGKFAMIFYTSGDRCLSQTKAVDTSYQFTDFFSIWQR